MKKFYSLVLAAAMCLSGAAATLAPLQRTAITGKTMPLDMANVEVLSVDKVSKPKKAPAKAAALTEDGKYGWASYSLLSASQELEIWDVVVTLDANGKDASINGIMTVPIKATVDLEAGTFSIDKQLLGKDDTGDVYFFFYEIAADGMSVVPSDATTCTGTFTEEGIEFDEKLVWMIGGLTGEDGFYVASYFNMFVDPAFLPQELPYGTGVFTERIFSPMWELSPDPYEVEIAYIEGDENTLLVKDAAKGFYELAGWKGDESPTWTLDITDPENVQLGLSSLDFGAGDVSNFYVVGRDTWYSQQGQQTADAEKIKCTKEGNTLTIVFPVKSCLIYAYPTGLYTGSPEESTLVITVGDDSQNNGVANVAADANAPVEYFNLQGVKVENPANGVYIRRQGDATTKVLVK